MTKFTKSSSRREFLKKSTLGVASAGFLETDFIHSNAVDAASEGSQSKQSVASPQEPDITISVPCRGVCIVTPGKFHIGKKPKITFFADNTNAILFFPDPDLTDSTTLNLKANETGSINIKPQNLERERFYRYTVFSTTAKKYGIGNSEPEMIVP